MVISGASLPLYIYVLGFALGVTAGFVMHRSDYCVAGMFRDLFMFRSTYMLRVLALQIVFTMILFEAARLAGFLPHYPFPLLGTPSLSNLIGGTLFGVGMVLAGGCVVGTLYKLGAGSIISATAFVGLILGCGLYAEIHPYWAVFIKRTTLSDYVTLPQAMHASPTLVIALVATASVVLLVLWRQDIPWRRASQAACYLQPWKAAILLGLIGLGSYLLVGMPLGITTTYAKMAAMAEKFFVPTHAASLSYFKATPLNAVNPALGYLFKGGPGPEIDGVWLAQFPVIAGIVLGSALSAVLLREFAIHLKVPAGQLLTAFIGGTLLGFSSRLAPSCNVWHLMGGVPILAMQSILFLVGLLPGTWLGSKILSAIILRQVSETGGGIR